MATIRPPSDAGKRGIQPRGRALNPVPPRPTPRPWLPSDPIVGGRIEPLTPGLIGREPNIGNDAGPFALYVAFIVIPAVAFAVGVLVGAA